MIKAGTEIQKWRDKQLEWFKDSKYRLSSFDEIVEKYENIVPLRGKRASQDIRPLARRAYWWRRIIKFSDTCYGLNDGNAMNDNNRFNNEEIFEKTLPILWERKEDGDYITIHNHINDWISISRYEFLYKYLPKDLSFWYCNGKHYIHHAGQDYFLPKSRVNIDYVKNTWDWVQECKVVFKVNRDGTLTRANELQPYKTRGIDKDMRNEYLPKIKAFWDWAQVVLPVLGTTILSERNNYANTLCNSGYYWRWQSDTTPELARAILDNEDDDRRVALAVMLANDVGAISKDGLFEHTDRTFKNVLNHITKVAQFYKVDYR